MIDVKEFERELQIAVNDITQHVNVAIGIVAVSVSLNKHNVCVGLTIEAHGDYALRMVRAWNAMRAGAKVLKEAFRS